jgi:hypothetical protein
MKPTHVFLEIFIHVLKHQHKLVLRMNHVVQRDDVLMLQLLHQTDFPDRRTRRAFFTVEVDLFQRNECSCLAIAAFEDLSYMISQMKKN